MKPEPNPMRTIRVLLRRLAATFVPRRRDEELEAELRAHLEFAAEDDRRRAGTNPRAVRVRSGSVSQAMDALRDARGLPGLDALVADVVFAGRQLRRHLVGTVAIALSVGLAVGATIAAFRLIDAVLLRPLPVVEPDRLFSLSWQRRTAEGETEHRDDFDYPAFRRYAAALDGHGDALLIGMSARLEVSHPGSSEPERVYRQYVSGNVFPIFGLRPALGRLLSPDDDVTPRGHPVAVISHGYWARRFARDPRVIGRAFRVGSQPFEIVGVLPAGFTGTEPGRLTDVYLPAVMNWQALDSPGWSWFRTWVRVGSRTTPDQVRERLQAQVTREQILLTPAGRGASEARRLLATPLFLLGALVALVLCIASVNVANVLGMRALMRRREMALRVSIGAGRRRLVQLVLIESALLAGLAAAVGLVFAWWAAPFVLSLLTPLEHPIQLVLDANWRVAAFVLAVMVSITLLFGLAPAARASAVTPMGVLGAGRGTDGLRRLPRGFVAAQSAFCVLVLFVAGLLVASFGRLSTRPLGFVDDGLLVFEAETGGRTPPAVWTEVADRVSALPGVSSAALAGWAPLTGNAWRGRVQFPGRQADSPSPYLLDVSRGYFDTMGIPHIAGRDFRPGDTAPAIDGAGSSVAGVAIVNEAFSAVYFGAESPVGRTISLRGEADTLVPMDIIGLVGNVVYQTVREPLPPTVYVPLGEKDSAALLVRAAGDDTAIAAIVRRETARAHPELRVSQARPATTLVQRELLRERLLAAVSSFFAVVGLLLAAVGLSAVLNMEVMQRRRELGIRLALGAGALHVIRRVTADIFVPVGAGALLGLGGGVAVGRLLDGVLFQVTPTAPASIGVPLLVMAAAATVATLQPVVRAIRTDPALTLRAE
jgi:predicted permease